MAPTHLRPAMADHGFRFQISGRCADRCSDCRRPPGATRMDRPEDVQPNEVNGRLYVILSNNTNRKSDELNAANLRADNAFGHIIEMTPPDGDHAADTFSWEILVRCGDPAVAAVGALWNPETSSNGWFASPDNAAVDNRGRLWVSIDQGEYWPRTGRSDGLYALETDGERRRTSKLFFRCPIGAELCGPCFTPDGETLFVAVQHPAADGAEALIGFGRPSSFKDPATRWPDFDSKMPPRPSFSPSPRTAAARSLDSCPIKTCVLCLVSPLLTQSRHSSFSSDGQTVVRGQRLGGELVSR